MKAIIFPILIFCLLPFGCSNNPQKKAERLHKKALFITLKEPDSSKIMKALELFNQATDLQADYYIAYANKLELQRELGLFDDSFSTLKVMEQLKPENPDVKSILGAFYEYHQKDTIQAMLKYNEADLLYKSILDTFKSYSPITQNIIIHYAMNLRLLKTKYEAINVLKSFFEYRYCDYGNEEQCLDFKKFIYDLTEKQTREQLLVSKSFTPIGSIWY